MLNACCLLQAAATCKILGGDLSGALQHVTACDALQERCNQGSAGLDEASQRYLNEIMSFAHGLKVGAFLPCHVSLPILTQYTALCRALSVYMVVTIAEPLLLGGCTSIQLVTSMQR